MHCAAFHWGELSEKNVVELASWEQMFNLGTDDDFRRLIGEMLRGVRPRAKAAVVLAGSLFPKDDVLREWFMRSLRSPHELEYVVPALYALCPHMDYDEDIPNFMMRKLLRWSKLPQFQEQVQSLQNVFSIWRSSSGSLKCSTCLTRINELA